MGWVGILETSDPNAEVVAKWFRSTDELFAEAERLDVIAIDIPIGLADNGARLADSEARRLLSPKRSSSVFPAPVRAALAGSSWDEACELSAAACGKRLSKQSFEIMWRIREVDDTLRANPHLVSLVREIHPEVSFYFWNGHKAMAHPKRTPEGLAERRALVESDFGSIVDRLWGSVPRGVAAMDDLIDAFAALWTARRIASKKAVTVPAAPPRDRFGLRMEMVA